MNSAEQFLVSHWQKEILMQAGTPAFDGPTLSVDEIAWLATQPDVESRLVYTERRNDGNCYRLENGPFSESELGALPDSDWTLLVQDVEKHLPEFRQWFEAINFIPDWRIDDLMISVAAPGGSVGPHVDNYDVFLIQVSGHRNWRIGRAADARPDTSNDALSLLLPFAPTAEWDASPSDVLYLPPGVPHWGVATSLCTTYSLGMRAPARHELRAGAGRILDQDAAGLDGEDAFYADPDLTIAESEAGRISPQAVLRIRQQGLLDEDPSDAQLAEVLGSVVTDPKAWLMPEPLPDELTAARIHGMARLAWTELEGHRQVFVNGVGQTVEPAALAVFRRWCQTRVIGDADLAKLGAGESGRALVEWLRLQGAFDTDERPE